MADLGRCRRILAGTLPPGSEAAPLTAEERRQVVRRVVIDQYQRLHPPPGLDRLTPAERARFRPEGRP